jgi:hypothetical protein
MSSIVFVDAPIVLLPADVRIPGPGTPDTSDFVAPALDSQDIRAAEAEDPALTPRAWWRVNRERTISVGLESSLLVLRDVLRGSQFDVRCVAFFFPVSLDGCLSVWC